MDNSSNHSRLLEIWRRVLTAGEDGDPKTAVLAELASYFEMSPDLVRRRCENSKEFGREEWLDRDRSTPDALIDFWNRASPVFGITMSHAKQYTGEHPSPAIDLAEELAEMTPGKLLDFGCGPGTAAMFFAALGWKVTLSDVSSTMLDFAAYRLNRRGDPTSVIHPIGMPYPDQFFDVVTAFEVMAHVPDIPASLAAIRDSLKDGGLFVFNVYAPPPGPDTYSHLFEGNWHVIRHVRSTGFRRRPRLGYYYVYEKVNLTPAQRRIVSVVDRVRHNRFVATGAKFVRQVLNRARGKIRRVRPVSSDVRQGGHQSPT